MHGDWSWFSTKCLGWNVVCHEDGISVYNLITLPRVMPQNSKCDGM